MAVRVAVRVAVTASRSVGERGEAVGDLCLWDCKKTSLNHAPLTFSGPLTRCRGSEPGGPGIPPLGHVAVEEELAEEHEVTGVHQQRGLNVLVGHVTGQAVLK